MPKQKEEIRKLFETILQEDLFANQSVKALQQCLADADKYEGTIGGAVGCLFLLHLAASKQLAVLLAEAGWFSALDITYKMERELYRLAMAGESSRLDGYLILMYTKKFKSIKKKIVSAFPQRKELIEHAFWAHTKKRYALSIPVFLAQADGISMEMTNGEYFLKENGRPRTAKFVDSKILNPIYSQFFEPLRTNLPISANKDQRKMHPVAFNRHAILHGEDINYGTKIHSFKAISLLSYLSLLSEMLWLAKEPMDIVNKLLAIGKGN